MRPKGKRNVSGDLVNKSNHSTQFSFISIPGLEYWRLCLLLFFTWWVFHTATNGGFVWDDIAYVQTNIWLAKPMISCIKHFLNFNFVQGNYHPLTMILYSVIYKFAHLNPEWYHRVSIIFHLANTLLVYIFYSKISNHKSWASLLVAGLFAIHPLHLESVAWISSLKDVLFVFFFLLGLISYVQFTVTLKERNYNVHTFIFFILAVLSKPTAVVFPVILVCVDYLKEGRFTIKQFTNKWPYFIISFVMGVITIIAQKDSINVMHDYSWLQRLQIFSEAMIQYFSKLLLTMNLSALHPLPALNEFNFQFVLSPILLILLSIIWVKFFKGNRWVNFGLLFFLVTIGLTLQFVTVGMAIISERYTYLSYVGLFIVLIEFINILAGKLKFEINQKLVPYLSFLPIFIYGFITHQRVSVWKNNETLWSDVLLKYPNSTFAHYNLGTYYFKETKDINKAELSFQKATQLDPKNNTAWINLAVIAGNRKDFDLAFDYFEKAKKVDENFIDLYKNRGYIYALAGQIDLAISDFSKYLTSIRSDDLIFYFRGMLYFQSNRFAEAISDFSMAIELQPGNGNYYFERSKLFLLQDQLTLAKSDALKARSMGVQLNPELSKLLEE